MKRKDLILHLLGEISSYILEENPRRMVVSLYQEKDGLHLSFMDDNDHSDDELVRLKKLLNSPKRPELAGYYGAMTGHDMLGSTHLDLLGWQVKHADVSRIDKGIKIDLWLGGERFQSEHFTIPNKSK
jgi:hypothetical protein